MTRIRITNPQTWLSLLALLSFLLGPGPSLSAQQPKVKETAGAQSFASTPLAQISEASPKLTASTSNLAPAFSTASLPVLAGLLVVVLIGASKPIKWRKLFLQYGKLQLDGA
jgi:hypothetical protein